MFCKNCGAKLENKSKFCVNCGWQVGSDVTKESKIKSVSGIKIPIILIIGVIAIAIISFLVKSIFFGRSNLDSQSEKVKVVTEYNLDMQSLDSQSETIKVITEYSPDTSVDKMDTIIFGSYPQSDISGKKKEPIEWIVLEKNDSEMLLLSKYILDNKCYNDEKKDIIWENCTLRQWLNDAFYNNAFSDDEKTHIIKSNVENKNNSEYGTLGGNDTSDYVYTLSVDECRKYFGNGDNYGSNKRLATKGTEYAKNVDNHGDKFWVVGNTIEWYCDNSYFWLRSPGNNQNCAASVHFDGRINTSGYYVYDGNIGLRPLIRVKYK